MSLVFPVLSHRQGLTSAVGDGIIILTDRQVVPFQEVKMMYAAVFTFTFPVGFGRTGALA